MSAGKSIEELERHIVVRTGKRICRFFMTYYHNLTVLQPCPIPEKGGGIVICNHISSLDPIPLQAACPRLITWMMAREYAQHWGTRWFFNAVEPILVERSGRDLAATRMALRALAHGKLLGLFPEGRIEPAGELLEFQTGIALLAIRGQVPIYPAYLDGTQRCKGMLEAALMPNRVTLTFGPPIASSEWDAGRQGLEEATARIRAAVAGLAGEADRGDRPAGSRH